MIQALISLLFLLIFLVIIFWIAKVAVEYFQGPAVILQILGLILLLILIAGALHILAVPLPVWMH